MTDKQDRAQKEAQLRQNERWPLRSLPIEEQQRLAQEASKATKKGTK